MMIHSALEQGEGILRLAPAWVPRVYCVPGRRLKLHADDLYAFGAHRGGINMRWFASTTRANNGPETRPDEGMSYVVWGDEERPHRTLLRDAVAALGPALLGEEMWNAHREWPIYSKFFDNKGILPHHLHQMEQHAALVGQKSKPEGYFFPRQMNNYEGDCALTFFGLEPGTTKAQVKRCLERWDEGDNRITDLSRAYRLELGTGWWVPAGILHAPGSLCTYEPQWGSDISAMFQSVVGDMVLPRSLLTKNVPPECRDDLDFLVSLADWEANTKANFRSEHFLTPRPVRPVEEMREAGYVENWIIYRNKLFAAKELTVLPGRTVTIQEAGPYGMIMVQGHGTMGVWPVETPTMIRFGQLTHDEYFVSAAAAREGVVIRNGSQSEPLVMLKHLGPGHVAPLD
jgi:hypothetical protein